MVYSSRARSEGPSARWDIIHRENADLVTEYLIEKYGPFHAGSHPIHSQKYYLTDTALEALKSRGVRVYTIYQHVGDAILIPAGCIHQVRLKHEHLCD